MRQRRQNEAQNENQNNSSVTHSEATESLDIGVFMINAGIGFAKRYKKLTMAYIIGLLVLTFATGFAVSQDQEQRYFETMATLDSESTLKRDLRKSQANYVKFDQEYRHLKGWLNCNRPCELALRKRNWAYEEVTQIKAKILKKESEAKSHLGVFSKYSVQEVRDLFWDTFSGGKDFAQRSSWFDLMFLGFDSMGRDEHLISFMIRFLFQVVMNFTLGMIGAFFGFIYYLGDVVNSYQPTFIESWLFYILAILGGFSVVTSFIVALYFSAAGTVYVAVKVGGNQILRDAQQRRRVQYRRY